ncbi:DUF3267 domain-containing protein [Floccifex sp.]|uniref:DUF3267 domain-containing protein n=1 Tax=Floccifex sp. TaxID=2815810 RepID=UPI003F08DAF5
MELIVKGRFNGDVNSLPSGQLKNHPNATCFKEFDNINTFSLVLNIASLFLLIGLYILMCLRIHGLASLFNTGTILSIICLLPHEFLHAICFQETVYLYIGKGILFVTGTEVMSRNRFIFMSLLPNLVFGFIPFFIFLIDPSHTILGALGLFSISAGIGDYYNVFNALRQVPKNGKCFMEKQHTYWFV